MGYGYLNAISVGRHPAYDRTVFQFAGQVPGYDVRYIPGVSEDARGRPVPLPGQAFLHVVFRDASEWDQMSPSGQPTHTYTGPGILSPYFPTLLQVSAAGDFEGYLSFGAGLSSRAGFNVFTLTNPDRVVIDVAHASPAPFPGIWDITSWRQYWTTQSAVERGHQPWLLNPAMVVQAWASGRWTVQPTIRQAGPNVFKVTEPGMDKVVIVSGTRPVRAGPAQIWVITRVVYASK
jgi:hypothetical protein